MGGQAKLKTINKGSLGNPDQYWTGDDNIAQTLCLIF